MKSKIYRQNKHKYNQTNMEQSRINWWLQYNMLEHWLTFLSYPYRHPLNAAQVKYFLFVFVRLPYVLTIMYDCNSPTLNGDPCLNTREYWAIIDASHLTKHSSIYFWQAVKSYFIIGMLSCLKISPIHDVNKYIKFPWCFFFQICRTYASDWLKTTTF